jgi:hypothetical protein
MKVDRSGFCVEIAELRSAFYIKNPQLRPTGTAEATLE